MKKKVILVIVLGSFISLVFSEKFNASSTAQSITNNKDQVSSGIEFSEKAYLKNISDTKKLNTIIFGHFKDDKWGFYKQDTSEELKGLKKTNTRPLNKKAKTLLELVFLLKRDSQIEILSTGPGAGHAIYDMTKIANENLNQQASTQFFCDIVSLSPVAPNYIIKRDSAELFTFLCDYIKKTKIHNIPKLAKFLGIDEKKFLREYNYEMVIKAIEEAIKFLGMDEKIILQKYNNKMALKKTQEGIKNKNSFNLIMPLSIAFMLQQQGYDIFEYREIPFIRNEFIGDLSKGFSSNRFAKYDFFYEEYGALNYTHTQTKETAKTIMSTLKKSGIGFVKYRSGRWSIVSHFKNKALVLGDEKDYYTGLIFSANSIWAEMAQEYISSYSSKKLASGRVIDFNSFFSFVREKLARNTSLNNQTKTIKRYSIVTQKYYILYPPVCLPKVG